jgi:hypothetical protein
MATLSSLKLEPDLIFHLQKDPLQILPFVLKSGSATFEGG